MSRFITTMTDAERDRLKLHRAALRLRSDAEVIRHWIAQPLSLDVPVMSGARMDAVAAEALPVRQYEHTELGVRIGGARPGFYTKTGDGPEIPVGPVERKPGSLAKKGKP